MTAAFVDGLERALWTAAEAAGAVGIIAGYQALDGPPDIPASWLPLAIFVVGGLLAGGKAWAATKWGNGTAATLPAALEPVPAATVKATSDAAWQDGYQTGRQQPSYSDRDDPSRGDRGDLSRLDPPGLDDGSDAGRNDTSPVASHDTSRPDDQDLSPRTAAEDDG